MISNFLSSTLNKALSGVIVLALAFAGIQTVRLSWAQATIERMKAKRDRDIAEAVIEAVEAERHAAAEHEAREQERHSHTSELRKAAADAPAGEKVKGVLDALRNS